LLTLDNVQTLALGVQTLGNGQRLTTKKAHLGSSFPSDLNSPTIGLTQNQL
jgi:hypothetical protein